MRLFSLDVLYAPRLPDLYFWWKSCVLYSRFYGRSRATSRSCDILNIQATEALKNGKIWESKAFDFQHQMWTWFVNFLDQKKQKLISKTELQFNTSV